MDTQVPKLFSTSGLIKDLASLYRSLHIVMSHGSHNNLEGVLDGDVGRTSTLQYHLQRDTSAVRNTPALCTVQGFKKRSLK